MQKCLTMTLLLRVRSFGRIRIWICDTKSAQITVRERNDVSDELSENSKKYAILRLSTWVSKLFPEWFVLLHGLLARTIH